MFGTYPVSVCAALSNQNEVFKLSRVAHSFALYVNVSDGPIRMKYSNKTVVIKASDCEQCAETERVELHWVKIFEIFNGSAIQFHEIAILIHVT